MKESTKAPRHWLLCGEFTGDRWNPRTNGHLRGKYFHLMTSSWAWNLGSRPLAGAVVMWAQWCPIPIPYMHVLINLQTVYKFISKSALEVLCELFNSHIFAFWEPFYQHGFSLIPAMTSDYTNNKVWSEITTYPFPNFNGATVEVWELIDNSSHTLLCMWLLIHAGIKVNPCW